MTSPDSLLTSSDHFNDSDCFKNTYQSHLLVKGLRSDSPMKGPFLGSQHLVQTWDRINRVLSDAHCNTHV